MCYSVTYRIFLYSIAGPPPDSSVTAYSGLSRITFNYQE